MITHQANVLGFARLKEARSGELMGIIACARVFYCAIFSAAKSCQHCLKLLQHDFKMFAFDFQTCRIADA